MAQRVRFSASPWTAAGQASLPITASGSFLRLESLASVMPSSRLLCGPPLSRSGCWAGTARPRRTRVRLPRMHRGTKGKPALSPACAPSALLPSGPARPPLPAVACLRGPGGAVGRTRPFLRRGPGLMPGGRPAIPEAGSETEGEPRRLPSQTPSHRAGLTALTSLAQLVTCNLSLLPVSQPKTNLQREKGTRTPSYWVEDPAPHTGAGLGQRVGRRLGGPPE